MIARQSAHDCRSDWNMRAHRFTSCALPVLLALLAISTTWILAASRGGFHPAGMACGDCHLGGKEVKPEQAHLLIASQEKLCGTCHQNMSQTSHPSGFAPRQAVNANYPLDWKGDLTCSTCHEVHGKISGLMRGTRRGKELCFACHDTKFFAQMRDQGESMMAPGYLDSSLTARAQVDRYSLQCMGCHNGEGDSRMVSISPNMVVRHNGASLNHPIGANYDQISKFGGSYRPVARLSKKILLPGGLVSCVSCHEGYSKIHGKLVLSNARSALCLECHNI